MPKAWTDKREHGILSQRLATAEGLDFQRRVLPLIQVIWVEAAETPHLRSFDRSGIDHLAWSDRSPFELVVQCKGFQVKEHELGADHARQCQESIRSFRASGLRTKVYLLIHNRDGRSEIFRKGVTSELDALVAAGQAERAELWDRQRLLSESFNAMLRRVGKSLRNGQLAVEQVESLRVPFTPVERIPLRRQLLLADQHSLVQASEFEALVADPADLILEGLKGASKTVVLGSFGFGKTTAMMRAIAACRESAHLLYGARISKEVVGVKDFLFQLVASERILEEFPDESRDDIRLLLRPTIEYMLKLPNTALVIFIDGLDESAFLSRRGGLQSLFNILDWVRVPLVLSMRTEFWDARRLDFETSFGLIPSPAEPRNKRIQLVELLPWDDEQIELLVCRYRDSLVDIKARERVEALRVVVRTDDFERIYGDIPRRPLFLRFILDSVAVRGVPSEKVGRASLFHDWAELKIKRDIVEPIRRGGLGRAPVVDDAESEHTALQTAWEAMLCAAALMTVVEEGVIELRSSCLLDDLLERTRSLRRIVEPTGLYLHSLLAEVPSRVGLGERRVAFAHRAFQEFFLAEFILRHEEEFSGVEVPPGVISWLEDLRLEGLIA